MLGDRARLSAALINGLSGKPRRPQGGADPGANLAVLLLPIITFNMNDSLARTDPEEAAIGRPTATARRLVEASVSPNTRRAYASALRRLDAWLDGRELDDVSLAAYLAELHDAGRASSSASMAVAAACFRAKLAGQPAPAGERTARVLAGYRRTAGDRGPGRGRQTRGRRPPLDHRQDETPRQRPARQPPPRRVDALEERRLRLGELGRLEVVIEGLGRPMVARDVVALAALLRVAIGL